MAEQRSSEFRFSFLLHLLLFVIVQAIFTIFDGAKFWIIFNLNDIGKEAVAYLDWLFNSFQLYDSEQLNYVTVVWTVGLSIHGIENIIEKISRKYNKAI